MKQCDYVVVAELVMLSRFLTSDEVLIIRD